MQTTTRTRHKNVRRNLLRVKKRYLENRSKTFSLFNLRKMAVPSVPVPLQSIIAIGATTAVQI